MAKKKRATRKKATTKKATRKKAARKLTVRKKTSRKKKAPPRRPPRKKVRRENYIPPLELVEAVFTDLFEQESRFRDAFIKHIVEAMPPAVGLEEALTELREHFGVESDVELLMAVYEKNLGNFKEIINRCAADWYIENIKTGGKARVKFEWMFANIRRIVAERRALGEWS